MIELDNVSIQDKELEGFELSPQQRRLWSLGGRGRRARCLITLPSPLQPAEVEAGVRTILERHEILRTVFQSLPGMAFPVQVILEAPAFDFRTIDLTGSGELGIDRLLAGQGLPPVDMDNGPTARFVFATLEPGRQALLVDLPAVCADSRSLDNFAIELATLSGLSAPQEPDEVAEEDEGTVQYADFASWINESLAGEEGMAGREFWSARDLSGLDAALPPGESPAEAPRSPEPETL